ncbi:MAG TPA: GTP-binding protein [Pseudolabrys sp.]|nr:GTP-binding protein [Pseudolabrys sp.]
MTDNSNKVGIPPDYTERLAETWEMLLGIGHATAILPNRNRSQPKTPFTMVSGFLGAGKTTLLNALLSEPHGRRLAVLVNDFGSINIDASLLRRRSADTISLSNGCVCCSLATGLTKTLVDLLQREERPEAIILEASGVAEPHGVVQIALSNPQLSLNGIVTVVDADAIFFQSENASVRMTIDRQIAAADIVILNKTDLAASDGVERLRRHVAKTAPAARTLETTYGCVPAEIILGPSQNRSHLRAEDVSGAAHRATYESITFTTDKALDETKICRLAESLPKGVLRAKGLIRLDTDDRHQAILQVAGRRWNLEKGLSGDESSRSELIVIGLKGQFDPVELRAAFEACIAAALTKARL